jgi:deoxyribose-phosphate aldolase
MFLTAKDVAKMIDLSCVRTISNKADIEEMVDAARKYGFGQVSVLQCSIQKNFSKTRLIYSWLAM